MAKPYNLHWRKQNRRKSALERLEKQIKQLAKQDNNSAKIEKARECAANLYKKLG